MTVQFILAQIFALIAWLFLALSYHTKRENKIILFQVISGMLYCVSYLYGGATTGFLISLFETIIALSFYKTDKDKYIYSFTIPIYILIGYISSSSDGMFVLVPILGSLIDGYGMIRNNKIMVLTGIFSNFLWLFYDLYYLEYVTALGDLLLVISNLTIVVFWIYKYLRYNNIKISVAKKLDDNEIETIRKLDEECYDKVYRWSFEKLKELYMKENDGYILVRDGKNIVGYACFLNVTPIVYNKVKESKSMVDTFKQDDVKKYNKNDLLYINLNSIVLKREYNNKKVVKKMEDGIKLYINKKIKNNYRIKEIYIYTVNEFEKSIIKDLNYSQAKKITEECILYNKSFNL